MMMGGTASQDGNLAQLSKVSKEKPPIKKLLKASSFEQVCYSNHEYKTTNPGCTLTVLHVPPMYDVQCVVGMPSLVR